MRSVAVFLTLMLAMLAMLACSACGTSHGSSGSSVVRTAADDPGAGQADVPETLGAATAAAQANIDRFTAGDFAGVWEHMAKHVRDRITQADFVTFYATCKKIGTPISVTGVRLQPDAEAIVLMKIRGVDHSRIMVYESGRWDMQPTDDFAQHLGEPVAQIIAEEKAAGLCTR